MLERKQIDGAVDAVLSLLKAKDDSVTLVDQPKKIDIQFTLKQIPKLKHKTIPIDLPASIHYELREVCVFVKDLNKKDREYEATVQHYEDLFKQHKIENITKIVPVKALRTDYSLPSSKVSLAKAYDLYLADSSVMGVLPGILGKIFYAKKKTIPVKVNLGAKKLKSEVDRAINNTRCTIQGSGSSCLVTVAHDKLKKKEIIGNILAASKHLMEQVPGGQDNIRNMYIKSADTTAVPIYLDIESANKIKLPEVKANKVATYVDEITTVEDGQVMIRADGHVMIIKESAETDGKGSPKVVKGRKGKQLDGKGSKEDTEQIVTEIKEENDDSAEFVTETGDSDDNDDVEIVDSDNEDKDDVQAEISKSKKRGKSGKGQKKRKSEGSNEGVNVNKKKQKWTEVATAKQDKKLNKKGKKARKA